MNSKTGKGTTPARAALVWLSSLLILSLASAAILHNVRCSQKLLYEFVFGILLTASCAGMTAAGPTKSRGSSLLAAVLYAAILSVILLMIGFLIRSEHMGVQGLLRILAGCFGGAVLGSLLRGMLGRSGKRKSFPGRR